MVIPGRATPARPDEPQSHEGYEWFYVLSGRVRLRLADHDLVLAAGEAAEFDTRVPHWFGSAGPEPAEILSLFGPQGERIHTRPALSRGPDPAQPHQVDAGPVRAAHVVDQHGDRSAALRAEPGEAAEPAGAAVVPPQVTAR